MPTTTLHPARPGRQLAAILIMAGIIAVALTWVFLRTPPANVPTDVGTLDTAEQQLAQLHERYKFYHNERDRLLQLIPDVRQLAQSSPEFAAAHTLLAQVLLETGQSRQALDALQHSLEIDPNQAEIQCLTGVVAQKLDDYPTAMRHYSQAVGLDPRNGRYRLHQANIKLILHEYEDAKPMLLAALKLDSSLHEAHSALSGIYARENKLSLALDQIRKAITQTPATERTKHVVYVRKQALLELRDGRPDDALITLKEKLDLKEQFDLQVMEQMATCWANQRRLDLAAKVYEDGLRFFEDDTSYLEGAARWRLAANDIKLFKQHLSQLRRFDADANVINKLERDFERRQAGDARQAGSDSEASDEGREGKESGLPPRPLTPDPRPLTPDPFSLSHAADDIRRAAAFD